MSELAYQSFSEAKRREIIGDQDLTEELFSIYDDAITNPNIDEFLDHQWKQYELAEAAGVTNNPHDIRWRVFRTCIGDAALAVSDGDLGRIAVAFTELGRAIEELHQPTIREMLDYKDMELEKLQRELPLKQRNLKVRFLKDAAEIIAKRVWEKDTNKKIRLAEACELVWPELVDVAVKYKRVELLPDKPQGLRPWLKEYAPEYAKKGGRPKKEKK